MAMQATDLWQQYIDSGNAACRERRYEEAEQFYARALSEAEQTGIPEDCLALSINNLAWVSHRLGKYRQAEPLYLRALSLVRRLCGLEHPDVATVLQNMARMYSASDRGDIAEQMLRQALDIRRKAFGPDNDQVLATHEEFRRLLRENEARIKAAQQRENAEAPGRASLKSLAEDIAANPQPALQIPESLAVTSDPVSQMSRVDPSEAVTQLASQIEAITMLEDSQACTIDPVHADTDDPHRQTKQLEPSPETVSRIEQSQACTVDPIRQGNFVEAPQQAPPPPVSSQQPAPPPVQGAPVCEVAQLNPPVPKVERPGPIKINAPQPSHTNQAASQLRKANNQGGFKIPRPGATPRVVPPVPNFTSDQASTLTEMKASEIVEGLNLQGAQEQFAQDPMSDLQEQALHPSEPTESESLETTVDYAFSPFGTEPEVEAPVEEPTPQEVRSDLPSTSLVKPARPNAAIRPEAQPEQAILNRINPTPGEGKNPLQVRLPRPDAVQGPIPEIPPFVVTDNAETLMEVKVAEVMSGIPQAVLDSYSDDSAALAATPPMAVPPVAEVQPPPAQHVEAETAPAVAQDVQSAQSPEVTEPAAEEAGEKPQGKRKRKAVKAKLPRPGVVPTTMPQVPPFINSDQIATLAEIPTGGLFDDADDDEEPAAPVQPVIGGSSFFMEDQPAPVAVKVESPQPPVADNTAVAETAVPPPLAAQPVAPVAPAVAIPGVVLPPRPNSGQFAQVELPPPARLNQPAPANNHSGVQPVAPPLPGAPMPAPQMPAVAQVAPAEPNQGTAAPHPSNVGQTAVPPLPGFVREAQPVMPFRSDIDLGSASVPPPVAPNVVPPVPAVPPHHVPPVPSLSGENSAAVQAPPIVPPVLTPDLQNAPAANSPLPTPAATPVPPPVVPMPGHTPTNNSEQSRAAFVPQTQPAFALGDSIEFPDSSKDQKAFPEFFSGGTPGDAGGPPPGAFASLATNIDPESDETINLDRLGRAPDQLNTMNNIPKIRLVPPASMPQPVFGTSGISGGPPPVEVSEPVSKQRIPRSFEHIEDDEDEDLWPQTPQVEKTTTASMRKAVSRQSVSPKSLEDLVDESEKLYDVITTCVGGAIYGLSLLFLIGFIYLPIMIAWFIFKSAVLHGKVVSNGIKVSERQFPEIFTVVSELSSMMAMPVPPPVYIVNRNGFPNGFSATACRRDYIVLYADVLESLPEAEVSFLLAREMAHLKRGHTAGSLVRLPAMFVPFIGAGYARGCELTADRFGKYFKPEGARMGLVYLMCSPKLVKKVNMEALYKQAEDEQDTKMFDAWGDQPSLSRRIKELSKVVKIG